MPLRVSGSQDAWSTRTAYAAALWAFIFAVFHVIWAAGRYVGLDADQARVAFAVPWKYAYNLVVAAMCIIAVVVALAWVRPWGHRAPRGLRRVLAWTGTGLLVLRCGASLVQTVYLLAIGRFSLAAMGIWEPWFLLGAILFVSGTWRHERRTGRPA